MSTELPPFSGDEPRCSKCGNRQAGTVYRPSGQCLHDVDAVVGVGVHLNERLCRRCSRCDHAWDEAIVPPEQPLTGGGR